MRDIVERLTPVGGLSVVQGRDGVDRVVVNNPWEVANPILLKASTGILVMAIVCLVIGMFASIFMIGTIGLCFLAMVFRILAPAATPYQKWNDFVILGTVEEVEKATK